MSDYGRLLGGIAAGVVWLAAGYLGDGMLTPGEAFRALVLGSVFTATY